MGTMSLSQYVLSYGYLIFTTIFTHGRPSSKDNTDVEMYQAEAEADPPVQLPKMGNQTVSEYCADSSPVQLPNIGNQTVREKTRHGEGATQDQDGEPELEIVTESVTSVEESQDEEVIQALGGHHVVETNPEDQAMPEVAPRRDVTGGHAALWNAQNIGLQVVGIWIVPVGMGVIGFLIQLVMQNHKAMRKEKRLLSLCLGASLTTIILGVVLFSLCIIPWNNPRKGLIITLMVVAAFGFVILDLSTLMGIAFIVVQSNLR